MAIDGTFAHVCYEEKRLRILPYAWQRYQNYAQITEHVAALWEGLLFYIVSSGPADQRPDDWMTV